MFHRRILLGVLIAVVMPALPDRAKTAEPAVDKGAGFRLWEVRGRDANEPPNSELCIPKTHPYLALTPQDVERAKDRAARWDWAKQAVEKCRSEADGYIGRPWGKLPDKGDTEHWNVARRLFSVGLAYALSGEPRYAEWTRDGLLAYADLYPRLPLTNARCKVFTQSSLYEAIWLVDIVRAYDLVADGGLFGDEQKRRVETDLLRASLVCFKIDDFQNDARIRDLHYRCYNFQAWHLAAIGLVGLAVRDADLADYAVHSPYGLRHLIAHDIRDDGLFWERSVGYHHFVVSALVPFTEAMAHCGVDLYGAQVPNDRARDEDAHYITDTSDEPKSLRLLFESPLYLAFPDLSYPALGDSDRGPLRGGWPQLVGFHRYREPKLAWLLQRDVPVGIADTGRGRVGLLHYYRYHYRYDNLRLNGKPVAWRRPGATYEVQGDSVVASDSGTSQPDRYLLTDAELSDFVLEWTMTRLADMGSQDRAWVVFRVHPRSPAHRSSFVLASHCPQVDQPYRFRLEVRGERTELTCDGRAVASEPIQYHPVPDWPWLIYDLPSEARTEMPELKLAEGTFANRGEYRNGCSLFPSSGVAVLREAAGDFTKDPDGTAASMSFGPYGGGHGHPDKLNLVLYAQGRQWLPDFGSMPYESSEKAEWTAHTVSHNTVVVDGVSQRPSGKSNFQWPVDHASDKIVGKLERFDPAAKLVTASCDCVYEGITLQRTVQLSRHCVVDDFRVASGDSAPAPHRFDYVLHVDGDFADGFVLQEPRSGQLGDSCGYQHVRQKQGVTTADAVTLRFTSGKRQLRVWIVPTDESPTEVMVAEGPTNTPDEKMPMLILRRTAAHTRFVTVLEPVKQGELLRAVRSEKGEDGEGSRLVLQWSTGTDRVLLRSSGSDDR
ncbi:MAG TPA: heparinase II/III family protein [Thermoguttaceae bacterium]|nr:heparinase II/III family protein [Thermoguttaceae bacterium]